MTYQSGRHFLQIPGPGRPGPQPGLRDVGDGGAVVAAEPAAHSGVHPAAAVAPDLHGWPEVAGQPPVRPGWGGLPGGADVRPDAGARRTVPRRVGRTFGQAGTGAGRSGPAPGAGDSNRGGGYPGPQLRPRHQQVDAAMGPLAVGLVLPRGRVGSRRAGAGTGWNSACPEYAA